MDQTQIELGAFHTRVTKAHTGLLNIRVVKEWFLMNVAEGCGLHPDVITSYLQHGYCEERIRQTVVAYFEAAATGATMSDEDYLRIISTILRNDLDPYQVAIVIQPQRNRDTDEWESLMDVFSIPPPRAFRLTTIANISRAAINARSMKHRTSKQ
jgi:hypothetical protein